jgi:hypothetical protein
MTLGKKIAAFSALAGFTVIAGVFLVEIGLRVVGVSYPSFFDLDRNRGNALHPHAEGWFRDEGESYVRINSQGLNDREHDIKKPAGTFRIAVLGDSYAEAFQVPHEKAFWAVLEKQLSSCPAFKGTKIEVINFGISGHGTSQEYLTLTHHGWQYSPDLVMVAFYTANDVRNNSRALEKSAYRPYFVFKGDKMVLDNRFRELPDYAPDRIAWIRKRNDIINASRTVQLLRTSYNRLKNPAPVKAVPAGAEAGINYDVYRPPKNHDWREAWRVTEQVLRLMHRDTKAKGAELWLTTLTSGIQVHPDMALRQQVMDRLGVKDLTYPDRRLRRFAVQRGIASISLVDPLQKYVARTKEFLHGFNDKGKGHWNATGHRLGGEIMAQRICASRNRVARRSSPAYR